MEYCVQEQTIKPAIYQHYRTGKYYEVIGIARFSEDPSQEFVVYKQLYEATLEPEGTKLPAGSLWIRPKEMFFEMVDRDGIRVPRFKKIE